MSQSVRTWLCILVVCALSIGCTKDRSHERFVVNITSDDPARELLVQGNLSIDGVVQQTPPTSTPLAYAGTGKEVIGNWTCATPGAALSLTYTAEDFRPMFKKVQGENGAVLSLIVTVKDNQSAAMIDGGPLLPPKAPAIAP